MREASCARAGCVCACGSVVELFTYIQMGGDASRIAIRPFGAEDEDVAIARLLRFAAAEAQCFLEHDRHKLLAAIESSFGELARFDQHIHGLLAGLHRRGSFAATRGMGQQRLSISSGQPAASHKL